MKLVKNLKKKIQLLSNIPSIVEFPDSDEKNGEREINVLIGIKNLIGGDSFSLNTENGKFIPEIDPDSISAGSSNYVEALDNLANEVNGKIRLLIADKSEVENTLNNLYSAIIARNAYSSDPKITLNKIMKIMILPIQS